MESAEFRERPKILVVDDQSALASCLVTILKLHGYEAAAAFSGEEAIATAFSYHPDFLLSDIDMGALNGIDAAIEILHFQPRCEVLFISGNAECHNLLEQAKAKGFVFEVLTKPVFPSELLEKISQRLSLAPSPARAEAPLQPPAKVVCTALLRLIS